MTEKPIDGFIRAPNNPGAIINTDKNALLAYKAKKKQFAKINNIEERMDNIESMLSQILQKLKVD